MPHDTPKPPGYTRFVCISDTHSRTDAIQMPYGDVFIHAGDFTELGLPSEVKKFNDWLGQHHLLSIVAFFCMSPVRFTGVFHCVPLLFIRSGQARISYCRCSFCLFMQFKI